MSGQSYNVVWNNLEITEQKKKSRKTDFFLEFEFYHLDKEKKYIHTIDKLAKYYIG